MSLQGSIETFALPDVLGLLAITRKSGELQVVAGNLTGSVWLAQGEIVHSVVGGRELQAADGVFELLRLSSGNFSFLADALPPRVSEGEPVEKVLAAAQAALSDWREISKVVPDVGALVALVPEPPGPQITLSADQWRLLVAVAGGRTVRELMELRGAGEFETCKAVKALVDAGLGKVDSTPARPAEGAGTSGATVEKAAATAGPGPAGRHPAAARSRQADGDSPAAILDDDRRPRSPWTAQPPTRRAGAGSADLAAPAAPPAGHKSDGTSPADAQVLVAQLAALAGDDEEAVAEKVAAHLAEGGELPAVADANEPINRGLLLKFLSSVRS